MSVDGASLRRTRIQEIVEFIHTHKQVSTEDIENLLLLSHGMKNKTTQALLFEIAKTGIIKSTRDGRWTTPNDKLYRLYLGKGKEIGDTREREREQEQDRQREPATTGDDDNYVQ